MRCQLLPRGEPLTLCTHWDWAGLISFSDAPRGATAIRQEQEIHSKNNDNMNA